MSRRILNIARSDPGGSNRRTQSFELSTEAGVTVLDALFVIQRDHEPSLAFRFACRVGMCGTCAVFVNRVPKLACRTRLESLHDEIIRVDPLPHLPVLKDLIVSLAPFFEQWKKVRPGFRPFENLRREPARIQPSSEFGRQTRDKRDCITCGACFAACGVKGSSAAYLGPAAINRAFLRLLDPRDRAVDERLAVLNEEFGGIWRCHTQFNCVAACPKGINLTDSILRLKRAMLRPGKFYEKLHRTDPPEV